MADFLDDEAVEDIAESHIEKIRRLEDDEAQRILKQYKRARQDLRDKLDVLPAGKFTAQQVRGALLQVELAIKEMNEILGREMSEGAERSAEMGIDHLVTELNKYSRHFTGAVVPINLDAAVVATNTASFLFNQYQTSLEAYGQSLRSMFATQITQGIIQELTTGQVIQKISQTFLGEEWKLHRIVRTELHNVYNIGKIDGMKALTEADIPDLKKALYHPKDLRTGRDSLYADKLDLIVPVDQPFKYKWAGKVREFMAPPDRPNDRAILIPYRESWES